MTVDITGAVTRITNRRVKEIAEQMKAEMKEIIASGGHIRSGKAYNSIDTYYNERGLADAEFESGAEGSLRGGFLTNVMIGSYEKSAYYLDQGNGGSSSRIYPHGNKLVFKDSRKGGTRLYSMPSVRGYDGIHFVEQVANRHR